MPVENGVPDPRLWARPARQHVPQLPVVPLETPLMRERRRRRHARDLLIGLIGLAAVLAPVLTR
jgi:hypothetical protein